MYNLVLFDSCLLKLKRPGVSDFFSFFYTFYLFFSQKTNDPIFKNYIFKATNNHIQRNLSIFHINGIKVKPNIPRLPFCELMSVPLLVKGTDTQP